MGSGILLTCRMSSRSYGASDERVAGSDLKLGWSSFDMKGILSYSFN